MTCQPPSPCLYSAITYRPCLTAASRQPLTLTTPRMQSKIFPELVNNGGRNCTGPNPRPGLVNNGFYSQADIARLVEFAKRRGIRLVPEFDMPGHSGGFCHGLKSAGIKCCTNGGMGVPQIEDDPQGARRYERTSERNQHKTTF